MWNLWKYALKHKYESLFALFSTNFSKSLVLTFIINSKTWEFYKQDGQWVTTQGIKKHPSLETQLTRYSSSNLAFSVLGRPIHADQFKEDTTYLNIYMKK